MTIWLMPRSSTGGGGGGGGGSSGTIDSFNRPDSASPGSNWVEVTNDWGIEDNQMKCQATGGDATVAADLGTLTSVFDITVLCSGRAVQTNGHMFLACRSNGSNVGGAPQGWACGIEAADGAETFHIYRNSTNIATVGTNLSNGEGFNMRLKRQDNNYLYGKAWSDSISEPADFNISGNTTDITGTVNRSFIQFGMPNNATGGWESLRDLNGSIFIGAPAGGGGAIIFRGNRPVGLPDTKTVPARQFIAGR